MNNVVVANSIPSIPPFLSNLPTSLSFRNKKIYYDQLNDQELQELKEYILFNYKQCDELFSRGYLPYIYDIPYSTLREMKYLDQLLRLTTLINNDPNNESQKLLNQGKILLFLGEEITYVNCKYYAFMKKQYNDMGYEFLYFNQEKYLLETIKSLLSSSNITNSTDILNQIQLLIDTKERIDDTDILLLSSDIK